MLDSESLMNEAVLLAGGTRVDELLPRNFAHRAKNATTFSRKAMRSLS
jgi:hypothetical protein